MDTLKRFFPYSFKKRNTVSDLVVGIIVYAVASIIAGAIVFIAAYLAAWIPVLGPILAWTIGFVGSVINLYCIGGIVLSILYYNNVLKD